MTDTKLDFRQLLQFKNALYDSEECVGANLIPLKEYLSIKSYFFKSDPVSIHEDIERECKEGDLINLKTF